MKRSLPILDRLLLLALLSSVGVGVGVPGPAAAQPAAALAAPRSAAGEATDLIGRLARGEYQAAAARFTETMRSAAPPEKLGDLWTTIQAQMGVYQKQLGVRTEKQGVYDVAFVTARFARSTVDFKVVVDRDGKIAGFFLVPPGQGQGPGAAAAPPPYVAPPYVKKEAFSERDAVVDADGARTWALAGDARRPGGRRPLPGAGAGPRLGAERPRRDGRGEQDLPRPRLGAGVARHRRAALREAHPPARLAAGDGEEFHRAGGDGRRRPRRRRAAAPHAGDRSPARLRARPQPRRHADPPDRPARSPPRRPDRDGRGGAPARGHHPRAGHLPRGGRPPTPPASSRSSRCAPRWRR